MRVCTACGAAVTGTDWHCGSCGWRPPSREGIPFLLAAPAAEAFTEAQARAVASIEDHFWFVGRNALIAWAIGRYAPHARTMLDVGCGTGHVLRALQRWRPGLRLTGVEASPGSLQVASRAVPSAEFVCADTRHLPYLSEFDVVGAFDVLEHVPEHAQAFGAIVRAARPGGTVVLTVPQHPALWSPLDDYSGHLRRYTRRELTTLAAGAELDLIRVTSFVSLLLPALLASRLAQRRVDVAPGREFEISRPLNAVGLAAMRLELAAIRAGVSLPVGGSLLLVGRRR